MGGSYWLTDPAVGAKAEEARKKLEEETKKAEEDAAREKELAPLKKSLRDEVDFLSKKFTSSSGVGGRGLF